MSVLPAKDRLCIVAQTNPKPHDPHYWWYTSWGGGHQLSDTYDPAVDTHEKNVRQFSCPGIASRSHELSFTPTNKVSFISADNRVIFKVTWDADDALLSIRAASGICVRPEAGNAIVIGNDGSSF